VARQEQAETDVRQAYAGLERTHRELQAIHELGRQIANAADPQQLVDIAARIPATLLGARGTSVVSFDRDTGRAELEMTWGLPDPAVAALRRRVAAGLPGEQCAGCRPLTAQLTDACPLLEPVVAAGCAQGIGRVVCLPLTHGQERLGVIVSYLGEGPAPAPELVNLLSIVGTEIATALEGLRLRARQLATLYAVDRATRERQGLDDVLDRALATTLDGWGAQAGAILLVDGPDGPWRVGAQRGLGEDLSLPGFGLAPRLFEEARAAGDVLVLPGRQAADGLESVAVAVLRAEGETIGALFLAARRAGAFAPPAANLLAALAHQLALAVRNAQLYAELRQMAVLEERRRLSREMHDGLAQTLGYLSMQIERLGRLAAEGRVEELERQVPALRDVIADAYQDVREATEGLRLTVARPGGLVAAIQECLDDLSERTGLVVELSAPEAPLKVAPETADQLLRIAQEALTNVRRHAAARHVCVRLAVEEGYLELKVIDDGRGFDPAPLEPRGHLGLATMRERARSIHGQFTVATGPTRGTLVTVRVPYEPDDHTPKALAAQGVD
jgi:signal transduction histidine kinase